MQGCGQVVSQVADMPPTGRIIRQRSQGVRIPAAEFRRTPGARMGRLDAAAGIGGDGERRSIARVRVRRSRIAQSPQQHSAEVHKHQNHYVHATSLDECRTDSSRSRVAAGGGAVRSAARAQASRPATPLAAPAHTLRPRAPLSFGLSSWLVRMLSSEVSRSNSPMSVRSRYSRSFRRRVTIAVRPRSEA